MSKNAQKVSYAEMEAKAASQTQEIADLQIQLRQAQEQLLQTREELRQAQEQLRERRLVCERAGTMAEAAMTLNGVYKAADDAAAQYLENIRAFTEQQHKICGEIEQTTRAQAAAMLRETEDRCRAREQEADAHWDKLSAKFEAFCADHKELLDLLSQGLRSKG